MEPENNKINAIHFKSLEVDYALPLIYVKEIQRIVEITPIKELPGFVKGVINLRGEILPVIDFAERAGLDETPVMLSTRFIVLMVFNVKVALLVDSVFGVIELDPKTVSRNLSRKILIDQKYIEAVFMYNYVGIVLVNIEKILSDKEFENLKRAESKMKKMSAKPASSD